MTAHVPLATSRYQNHQLILQSSLVPVRTTLGAPRWKLKFQLSAYLRLITPTRALFEIKDQVDFDGAYRAHLGKIGVQEIRAEIASISAAHAGKGLVLLCFEDILKLGSMPATVGPSPGGGKPRRVRS